MSDLPDALNDEERAELEMLRAYRYRAETFYEFVARFAPMYWPVPRHLRVLYDLINRTRHERVFALISYPPRHGKSISLALAMAWRILLDPASKNFYTSYGQKLSKDFGQKVRDMVVAMGVPLDRSSKAVDAWSTVYGGGLFATARGGSITGKGSNAGLISVDDIIKNIEESRSKLTRDKAYDHIKADVMSRLEGGSSMIICGTRWHEDDPIGRIARDGLGTVKWIVINLPAVGDVFGNPIDERQYPEKAIPLWDSVDSEHPNDSAAAMAFYADIRARGEYEWHCTPAETPILMADWKCKPISEVRPGDRIIGFARPPGTGNGRYPSPRIMVTTVLRTFSKEDVVCDFRMESGRKVRCTADHRWWTGRRKGADYPGRSEYAPARIGSRLSFACPPTDECSAEERLLWYYLAGIVDGEGHCGNTLSISQSQGSNPDVYRKIKEVLGDLGITYNEYVNSMKNKPDNWNMASILQLHSSRDVYRRLLRLTDPGKAGQMIKRLMTASARWVKEKDRVVDIIPGRREPVFALETTTGNYIAWGYASSNSLYQGCPRSDSSKLFGEPARYGMPLVWQGKRGVLWLDPAATARTHADWSALGAFAAEGYGTKMQMYVAEVAKRRVTQPQIAREARAWQQRYKLTLGVEAVGAFAGIPQLLREWEPGINLYEQESVIGDKFTRALPAAGAWGNGRILVPLGTGENAVPIRPIGTDEWGNPIGGVDWVPDYLRVMKAFTGVDGQEDDVADITAHAWNYLHGQADAMARWRALSR